MKKAIYLLSAVAMFACSPTPESQLCGTWIEVMPVHDWYVQGVRLKKDGTAESVGMQTLVYNSWSTRSGQLILKGESIGNGQTIAFSDTLAIISLAKDTLTLGKGGQYRISYVRQQPARESLHVKSIDGKAEAELLISSDSASVELWLSPQQVYRLSRRVRPDGVPVWNLEDDDTYHVEYRGEWTVSRRGKTLYTTSGLLPVSERESQAAPARAPYDGFQWERIEGAGLHFWAQRNDAIRVLVDPTLPGAVMVRDGDTTPRRIMQLFKLKNGTIDDVLAQLQQQDGWNQQETCRFQEIESKRPHVRCYVLVPTGAYEESLRSQMKNEPVPSTCNGWGVGNSGTRYFEIHDTCPDTALFVEIGQDAPLFDEQSIEITPASAEPALSTDILYTQTGILEIGHEVRSFTPDGGEEAYWIVDKTGTLIDRYDRMTGGIKNGQPLHATLKLEYNGKWEDGFAAEYAGTYFVREVIDLKINK